MKKCYKMTRFIVILLALSLFLGTVPAMEAEAAGGRWKEKKGAKYYVKPDGGYASGSCKIKGKYYVFSLKGKLLRPKKASLMKVGKKIYYVSPSGLALTDWHVIRNKLYNMDKTGAIRKNTKYQGIVLTSTGAAKNSREVKIKAETIKAIDSVTNEKMSKKQKLRACWNYLTSKKRFRYRPKYPDLNKEGWQRDTAYDMLKTKKGNCYSFACAFAAMANELGYKSYVVYGRIKGPRDGASDGFTRHAFVMIGGRYYDPEAQFAGWKTKIYGRSRYPMKVKSQKAVKY